MIDTLSERRLRWLGHVIRMDHQRIPRQALHWEVPAFKRGPGRPCTNWRSTVNKDLGITWAGRKWRWQLKTDHNSVGVWPNASTWMRVESGQGQYNIYENNFIFRLTDKTMASTTDLLLKPHNDNRRHSQYRRTCVHACQIYADQFSSIPTSYQQPVECLMRLRSFFPT